jgi:hypothetical protein
MKNKNALLSVVMLLAMLFGLAPQPVMAVSTCDWVQFVSDVSYPDGTVVTAGQAMVKTWKLKNIGTCTWAKDTYSLVFVDGKQMGDTVSVKMPSAVAPGATVDLTVNLTAPSAAGTYRGNWQLKNASAVLFGIGASANQSFWIEIKVGSGSSGEGYDFVANAGSATWTSGAGALTFPGTDGDAKGFGIKLDAPKLENGTTDSAPGLLMAPQNVYDGFIQAKYPAFTVQSGDHFKSLINCEYNATTCWVNFRLKYQIGDGVEQTFWTFNERYEGLYYTADRDLSSLAGQSVKFILYIGAGGYASGDRALWGAPRITRGGGVIPTNTPGPTPTTGPTKTSTPVSSTTDKVLFVSDVTYPDGTVVTPGQAMVKTWRIKNVGTSTWTNKYNLVYISGDKMGGPVTQLLTSTVGPNTTFDISVNLTAPTTNGSYRGYWMLQNDKGVNFGIGAGYDKSWWVDVTVKAGVTVVPTVTPTRTATPAVITSTVTPTATPTTPAGTTVFDFTAPPTPANWTGSGGVLAFPGTEGNVNGFAIKLDSVKMETGSTDTRPSILTVPQDATDGYIQGVFPAFHVLNGDRFKATIGCQYGATTCNVFYRLDYKIGAGPVISNFWAFHENYEGLVYNVNIDLSSLKDQDVQFILTITANGSASGDRAVWIAPRITR